MASAAKLRASGFAALACTASASLIFFGNGLEPRWPLMWLAPLPVLLFALRSSAWSAALVAGLAWLAGGLNLWAYFRLLEMPSAAWLAVFGLVATVFAAGILLMRALVRRGAVWSGLLALPAVWTTFEYLRNLLWPHGSAGSSAYSQLNFLPFLQVASLTGPWGMSFLLMLVPAGLAIAWHLRRSEPRRAWRVAGVTVGLITAALIFGTIRLTLPQRGPQVRVGLITSDLPENQNAAAAGADTERLLRVYAAEAEKLAARGAQVIVMPETLGTLADPDASGSDAILQHVADTTKARIVAGMVHVAGQHSYDEARIYAPGAAVRSYDKEHLLPPFENIFTPGRQLTLLRVPQGTWGVAICKDMDFADPARQNGLAGAGLMLVPGSDFRMDRFWHGHIAVMRGVEDGFSVARAATDGYLTVSDDRGRVVGEARSDSASFVTLLTEVPAGHERTLWLMLGDWFAWLAMTMLALILVRLAVSAGAAQQQIGSDEDKEDDRDDAVHREERRVEAR